MNLNTLLLTNNACYKAGKKITVKGIVVHSTGANNPNLRRYVGPDDGKLGNNTNNNHWNQDTPDGRQVCVHAFVGKLANGSVAAYQTLPWDMRGWHGGSGAKGSVNDTHIGFEICEDALTDPVYFNAVYKEAAELCAYLCKQFNLDPMKDGVIIGHYEGYARGIASNHGDPNNWLPKHGKSMNTFREYVKQLMSGTTTPTPTTPTPADIVKFIWDFFTGKGLNAFAVAGIMGNLFAESGLNPRNLQNSYEKSLCLTDDTYTAAVDNGTYRNFVKDCAGYGLAQWTYYTRKQALYDHVRAAGASIGDLTAQLNFLWKELQGYTGVMTVLRAAKTVLEASNVVLTQYEKPADQSAAVQAKRAEYGQGYYNKYAGKPTAPAPSAPAPVFKVGDMVQFTGGNVYLSSNAAEPTKINQPASHCRLTQTYNGKHPYHVVSQDNKTVFGWADAANVTASGTSPAPTALKPLDEIAKEVINGKWGNGQDRANNLTAAGYDAKAVQTRVNQLLK